MLTFNYFRRHSEYVTQLARRVGFDVCMLVVKLANSDDLAADARRRAALIVSEAVDKTLRKVDLAFDYQATGQDFAIVLPATNSDGARIVLEKIKSAVNRGLVATEIPAQISYTLHSLHEQPVKVA
jgi:GGDEF domain-containing protein